MIKPTRRLERRHQPSGGRKTLSTLGSVVVTCLAATFAFAGATPASAATQADAAQSAQFVQFLPPSSNISPDQRRALGARTSQLHHSRQSRGTALADPDDLRTRCNDHLDLASRAPSGWYADRFHQCRVASISAVVLNSKDLSPAGKITFLFVFLAWANNGVRQVDFATSIEDIQTVTFEGQFVDWPAQNITLIPLGCQTPSVICDPGTTKPEAEWVRVPTYGFTYFSAPGIGSAPDATVFNRVTFDIEIGTPPIEPGIMHDAVQTYMRFDTARGMGRANGTAFPDFVPTFSLAVSDPAVNEAALHIRDAVDNPTRTFPSWTGKTVPGKIGGAAPLHRMFDESKNAWNRTTSVAVCVDVWGKDYAKPNKQCDEYPMAATYEGSATGRDTNNNGQLGDPEDSTLQRFSARPIYKSDNMNAGNRLQSFYGEQRIIDGDPFYVQVAP